MKKETVSHAPGVFHGPGPLRLRRRRAVCPPALPPRPQRPLRPPPSGEPVPSEPTPSDSAGLSGTLEVWSSGEELGRFMEGFNQVHPDVTVGTSPWCPTPTSSPS